MESERATLSHVKSSEANLAYGVRRQAEGQNDAIAFTQHDERQVVKSPQPFDQCSNRSDRAPRDITELRVLRGPHRHADATALRRRDSCRRRKRPSDYRFMSLDNSSAVAAALVVGEFRHVTESNGVVGRARSPAECPASRAQRPASRRDRAWRTRPCRDNNVPAWCTIRLAWFNGRAECRARPRREVARRPEQQSCAGRFLAALRNNQAR